MVELEVVDDPLFDVAAHFLVVVLALVEDPLEIGNPLALRDLTPADAFAQDLADQLLVVIGS